MDISPVILEGDQLRLEPLTTAHQEALIDAAGDSELWNSIVTIVPDRATMSAYITSTLEEES